MLRVNSVRGIAVCAFLLFGSTAFAAPFTSTQSGDWNNTLTWGGAGVPGTGDTVTITSSHVVTVTDARVALTVTLDSTAGNKMLVIDSTGSLLVESALGPAVAINAPSPGSTQHRSHQRRTARDLRRRHRPSTSPAAAPAPRSSSSPPSAAPRSSRATSSSPAPPPTRSSTSAPPPAPSRSAETSAAAARSSTTPAPPSRSTARGAQTINGYTFNHFVVNKAGGTATLNGPITVNGNLTVSSGVLDDGGNQISLNGGGTSAVTVGSTGVLKLGSAASATFFPTPLGTSTMNPGSAVVYQSGLQQAINSTVNLRPPLPRHSRRSRSATSPPARRSPSSVSSTSPTTARTRSRWPSAPARSISTAISPATAR